MKSSTKKLIIALVVLVVVVGVALGIYFGTRPSTTAGSKGYTVEVTHKDGSTKKFSYRTDEEYLGAALLQEGLISGDEGPYGLYITRVDGEDAIYEEDSSYWSFYVNGEYAMQGADQTPVNDGDVFGFVYAVG